MNVNDLFTSASFAPDLQPQVGEAEKSSLRPPASSPAAKGRGGRNCLLGQPRMGAQHSLPKSHHLMQVFPSRKALDTTKKKDKILLLFLFLAIKSALTQPPEEGCNLRPSLNREHKTVSVLGHLISINWAQCQR